MCEFQVKTDECILLVGTFFFLRARDIKFKMVLYVTYRKGSIRTGMSIAILCITRDRLYINRSADLST